MILTAMAPATAHSRLILRECLPTAGSGVTMMGGLASHHRLLFGRALSVVVTPRAKEGEERTASSGQVASVCFFLPPSLSLSLSL